VIVIVGVGAKENIMINLVRMKWNLHVTLEDKKNLIVNFRNLWTYNPLFHIDWHWLSDLFRCRRNIEIHTCNNVFVKKVDQQDNGF